MSRTRVWQSKYDDQLHITATYLRGYSHAHSRKVWRELPPAVRAVNQMLRDSMQLVSTPRFHAQPDRHRMRFRVDAPWSWRGVYGSSGQ